MIRLAKFLADSGVASRRKAEELIKAAKVSINNKIVTDLATKVNEDSQNIAVNHKKILPDKKICYLLNKPVGFVCSVSDPHNKKTVLDLVPRNPRVVPVGRLDKDSEGLLLLTNDGDLVYKLTHPKFNIQKTYLVTTDKILNKNIADLLKKGIKLEEGIACADKVIIRNKFELEIIIHQGWNRQIRRMLAVLGYKVVKLTRIKEGDIVLGNLPLGKYKIVDIK